MSVRLVVLSNRLPIVLERQGGAWRVRQSTGGLITAISPVFRKRGGLWIGWSGTFEEQRVDLPRLMRQASAQAGFELQAVALTREEVYRFYHGFSNEIIWPLFHDLPSRCNFEPQYWSAYQAVNRKFARVLARNVRRGDYVWVHDYHLMNVAAELRRLGLRSRVGFFLHIPFPPLELFLKLPWRAQLLGAMLEYDIIGFQTLRDRRNFLECVAMLLPRISIRGRGQAALLQAGRRRVSVGAYPISIDFEEFAQQAASPEVSRRVVALRREYDGRRIMLGVDRLDYTKGVPDRLKAFDRALQRYPVLHRAVTFVQVVVPSREGVPAYAMLKGEIEGLVSRINGHYTRPGWVPIHYMYRSLDRPELTALYRAAHIGVVTPLKDGMNLVAKEYCACHVDDDGVLILSEFAGAAAELHRGALLINPFDTDGLADALHTAFTMGPAERRRRMRRLRAVIRANNIFRWVDSFLRTRLED